LGYELDPDYHRLSNNRVEDVSDIFVEKEYREKTQSEELQEKAI
jgi:hypothetical protein